ncbi:MAG: hypothetical protein A3G33_03520 [Omnitrophica bacterium RIFCSPLOWO2_12_FULL_44_17]|uniref:Type 4 fimbrial biogenesis protein PilX N-terminal domain-containing protein n=1 Tax=Candidatus Danuiimicrobium aquiferis TaxID=1801832 RepID=A0A1G1KTU0_9BACT|nr:MAG: hypothetical protein A3B72_07065 [Omnitrophica bacterium RIFCSPHIGHO2_02_FULL_45_28]OGW88729.1 MAG: hypothetical protein A3E74_05250 [Omnitrophica bacterium RIFCSPHIGHO2_12_FULL_44_12]OGW96384.1 MAG: hypothetical protein A3G33_03520 [Omnitrophica bacterium RIFCSPLOWO2_12_FULL_44_17]OGX04810.1 MAG: hypothetical protein A3J12_07610 [Omnitrophica bacterium RIFCSPLOWO2_02_FULL_44_11]
MKDKIRQNGKSSETGSILIVVLIILATLAIYGGVLVSAVYERSIHVTLEEDRLQALYLADAGLAAGINEVKSMRDRDGDGFGSIPKRKLGKGIYFAIHDPNTLSITGIGEVNDIQRRIRIFYEGI